VEDFGHEEGNNLQQQAAMHVTKMADAEQQSHICNSNVMAIFISSSESPASAKCGVTQQPISTDNVPTSQPLQGDPHAARTGRFGSDACTDF